MTETKGSTWILDNPNGKFNHQNGGAGSVNHFIIEPEGYIDGWLLIWKTLNGCEEIILSEKEKMQFINDLRTTSIEDRQIAAQLILNENSTKIDENLNTIRELKNRKLLTIKEIIGTVKAMLKIKSSSPEQIRRAASRFNNA